MTCAFIDDHKTVVAADPAARTWASELPCETTCDIIMLNLNGTATEIEVFPDGELYSKGSYFVAATMTRSRIGYGDASPQSTVERSLTIICLLIGKILYAGFVFTILKYLIPYFMKMNTEAKKQDAGTVPLLTETSDDNEEKEEEEEQQQQQQGFGDMAV
eukprot:CAMPEP_0114330604 /NCGR_PEP_ID=MMETSP0101-20121206/1869_1 /TAXON_ID=38822 ORGANISM="Pteridomonas danica, Strain PT" /NCGR_SAMPLE_ID=MMETSP0101 /ASSEMBLY_ACC=CAM_ASM_000211 /LENGTH=159 /DNA_ID=CAMNT_0001460685 /DNA_START=535 /DNA_END=1014 /DNA_ORIENTATION=+